MVNPLTQLLKANRETEQATYRCFDYWLKGKPVQDGDWGKFKNRFIAFGLIALFTLIIVNALFEKYQYEMLEYACQHNITKQEVCTFYELKRQFPGKPIRWMDVPCTMEHEREMGGKCMVLAVDLGDIAFNNSFLNISGDWWNWSKRS